MKTKLLGLIDFEKVNDLLDGFNKTTGFVIAIVDLKGNVLTQSGSNRICSDFHRKHPETAQKCRASDTELANKYVDGLKFTSHQCLNGLVDVVVPIMVKGEHIANLFSGQFFYKTPDISYFKSQAKKYGFDEKKYLEALSEVPIYTKEEVKTAMGFLHNVTQLISGTTVQKHEQIELNEALKESEETFRKLFLEASDAILLVDENGIFVECNQAALDILKTTREQFLFHKPENISPKYQPSGVLSKIESLKHIKNAFENGGHRFDWTHINSDGESFIVDISLMPIVVKGKKMLHAIWRDITHRKKAEEKLIESEKHNAFLVQTSLELVELTSIQQIYEFTVQKLYELLDEHTIVALVEFNSDTNRWKMKHIQGVGKKLTQLTQLLRVDIRTLEGDISTKYFDDLIKGGVVEIDFDLPGLFNNKFSSAIGKALKKMFSIEKMYCITYEQDEQIQGNITFTTNKKTKPINFQLIEAFIQQVSNFVKKQKAEERLKESEDRFKKLSTFTFEGIIIHDNAIVIDINQSAVEMIGYTRNEVIGRNLSEIIHPNYHSIVKENIVKQVAKPYHIVVERKDGTVFDAEVEARNITYNGEAFRVACIRDITIRKRAEMINRLQYNIAKASINSVNLSEMYEVVKTELNQLVDAKNLVIASYDEVTGKLIPNVAKDEKDEIIEWPAEKSLSGYLLKSNKLMLLKKADILQLFENGMIQLLGTVPEVWIGAPLKVENKILGVLIAQNYNNSNAYDEMSLEIFDLIAHELSNFIDRQQNEEKANKLSRAVEQSSVSIMITDEIGTIEYVNPFFTELTGYDFDEVRGKNPSLLKSGLHSSDFYHVFWDTIQSGKDWEGEFYNKTKNGEYYWANTIVTPVVNKAGDITNYISIKEDVTERKEMIQALVNAKEKAQESDKLKSAFLNNISHEIRTPLNGILGFADLLQDEALSKDDKTEMLEMLRASSNRLLNTFTDYMDMARIVSGSMKVHNKEVLIKPLFEKLIEKANYACEKKGLSFYADYPEGDDDALVFSDPDLIGKVFHVLIDNALKFTTQGSIRCAYKMKNGFVEFFVQDTGIGIAQDKLDAIFNLFTQEDSSHTRGYEGSGIGLSIANSLIHLLGGNISVTSEKGKGTHFVFTIPTSASNKDNENKNSQFSAKTRRKNGVILIVEDDLSNAIFLKAILKKAGYDFLHAENGQEAVDLCRQNIAVNLVFMDIKMPIMDGFEATKYIREIQPNLPIIATTAYAKTGDEQLFLESGFQDYLEKPINKDILFDLIHKYL